MKCIKLSEQFCFDHVIPAIADEFEFLLPDISVGLIGDGSEVLGFDDAISHDHNFCPRVVILIADERFDPFGKRLEQSLLDSAPTEYQGFKLLYGEFRKWVEVAPLEGFFRHQLGMETIPDTHQDWLKLDEQKLLEMTAGPIFFDPSGRLNTMVNRLAFYPEAVRYYLLHQGFVRLSEVSAIERAILRNDFIGIELYRAWFIYFAIKILHLQNRRYCPYRKWMGRSLEQLAESGRILTIKIEALIKAIDPAEVRDIVTDILQLLGGLILKELGKSSSSLTANDDLILIDFDWDAVIETLTRQIPKELKKISPLISPVTFWGQIFDYKGLCGNYPTLLKENLQFLNPKVQ